MISLLAAVLLLVQCGTSPRQDTPAQSAPPAKPTVPAPAPVVFDLDALYGLTIDQLKAKLGKPAKDAEANMDGSLRESLFKKRGFLLDVNYVVASRRVDILHFVDEAGKIPYKKLLTLGNADTASTRYKVAPFAGPFTGQHVAVAVIRMEIARPNE